MCAFCRLSCLLSHVQDQGTQTQIKKEDQTQMITNDKEIINQIKSAVFLGLMFDCLHFSQLFSASFSGLETTGHLSLIHKIVVLCVLTLMFSQISISLHSSFKTNHFLKYFILFFEKARQSAMPKSVPVDPSA